MDRELLRVADMQPDALVRLFEAFGDPTSTPAEEARFWEARRESCRGRILVTVFLQPSTRTRTSFMSSFMRLGGNCIHFASLEETMAGRESGESLEETGRFLTEYCDLIVLRTPLADHLHALAAHMGVPVISAGHGTDEHPTAGLNHLHTLWRAHGRLDNLTILAAAKFPKRCMHSVIAGLLQFDHQRVIVVSPVAPQRLVEWNRVAAGRSSEVTWCSSLEEAMEVVDPEDLDAILCDEGPSDYAGANQSSAPAAIITSTMARRLRPGAPITHLKPLLKMFDHELAESLRNQLATESRKSALMRAEIMRQMISAATQTM